MHRYIKKSPIYDLNVILLSTRQIYYNYGAVVQETLRSMQKIIPRAYQWSSSLHIEQMNVELFTNMEPCNIVETIIWQQEHMHWVWNGWEILSITQFTLTFSMVVLQIVLAVQPADFKLLVLYTTWFNERCKPVFWSHLYTFFIFHALVPNW